MTLSVEGVEPAFPYDRSGFGADDHGRTECGVDTALLPRGKRFPRRLAANSDIPNLQVVVNTPRMAGRQRVALKMRNVAGKRNASCGRHSRIAQKRGILGGWLARVYTAKHNSLN